MSEDSTPEPGSARVRSKAVKRSAAAFNGIQGSSSDISSDFMCPICFDLICEPYITACGHTFCRACICRSIEALRRCPKCSLAIHHSDNIIPNHIVNQQLQKFKKHQKVINKGVNKSCAITAIKDFVNNDAMNIDPNDLTDVINALQVLLIVDNLSRQQFV